MSAVVRPICINNSKLCYRRVTLFFISKVVTTELEVAQCHSKAHRAVIICHLLVIKFYKALYICNPFRYSYRHIKCFRLVHRSQTGLYRVYHIVLNFLKITVSNIALYRYNLSTYYYRSFALRQQLCTLCGTVGTLVILSRQVFHSKYPPVIFCRQDFLVNIVLIWL